MLLFQVKLVNIRNDDITDGNPKLTLGLIWTIILHFQVGCEAFCWRMWGRGGHAVSPGPWCLSVCPDMCGVCLSSHACSGAVCSAEASGEEQARSGVVGAGRARGHAGAVTPQPWGGHGVLNGDGEHQLCDCSSVQGWEKLPAPARAHLQQLAGVDVLTKCPLVSSMASNSPGGAGWPTCCRHLPVSWDSPRAVVAEERGWGCGRRVTATRWCPVAPRGLLGAAGALLPPHGCARGVLGGSEARDRDRCVPAP